ncbi:MAG: ribonuclease PH [Planctomycetes bacterium]|nr:ribonuclease PH [Planctomycetota bacterium]
MTLDSLRHDGRALDQLRPLTIERGFVSAAPGSVLITAGSTVVLCTASIEENVPEWLRGRGQGWMTAEYSMLPGSTRPRKRREREGKLDGRTSEIQRLIGRSLRAVADLAAIGERTIAIDCDVLAADGGTRTLSITGALVAAVDALRSIEALNAAERFPLADSVAAISVGIVNGRAALDLDYAEDVAADVDMNVVMTNSGRFVEVQGTGEEATFTDDELQQMLALARNGIAQLTALQRYALGTDWPW